MRYLYISLATGYQ